MSKGRTNTPARILLALSGLALLSSLFPEPLFPPISQYARTRSTLNWMRTHLPPASSNPFSTEPAQYAVAANLDLGHMILLWAERPVVGTMFSQAPVHVQGNARNEALLAASTDEDAYAQARATRVLYVLATPSRILPGIAHPERGRILLDRLLEQGGLATARDPALTHFRLIHESPEQWPPHDQSYARLFEVVPGAVLQGKAAPGVEVRAELALQSNLGRRFIYTGSTTADGNGAFSLRVPYSTEAGGGGDDVRAQSTGYVLHAGATTLTVPVSEQDVLEGRTLPVRLAKGRTP